MAANMFAGFSDVLFECTFEKSVQKKEDNTVLIVSYCV